LLQKLSVNLTDSGDVSNRTQWLAIYERIKHEIPAARSDLEEEFRALLGVVARFPDAKTSVA
jgi:hypothetical protein